MPCFVRNFIDDGSLTALLWCVYVCVLSRWVDVVLLEFADEEVMVCRRLGALLGGRTDTDRQTDGHTDRQTDRQTELRVWL